MTSAEKPPGQREEQRDLSFRQKVERLPREHRPALAAALAAPATGSGGTLLLGLMGETGMAMIGLALMSMMSPTLLIGAAILQKQLPAQPGSLLEHIHPFWLASAGINIWLTVIAPASIIVNRIEGNDPGPMMLLSAVMAIPAFATLPWLTRAIWR